MKSIYFLLAISTLLALSSCKKLQEKWIIGEWQVETLDRGGEPEYWVFNEDHTVLFINERAWGSTVDTLEGSWAIKSKMGNYVELSSTQGEMLDGKFFIEKLNSKVMQLTRREFLSGEKEAAYLRRELYK